MTIRRYVASADTTITNAYKENLYTRGTGSNMGASDSIEIFSLYGQTSTSSLEKTRSLIKFPIENIISDRNNGLIPSSGSVNFFIKLYNAKHPFTLPKDFYLSVFPLSQSWEEGYGLDMENYSDPGFNFEGGYGANWDRRLKDTTWSETGSSYISGGYDYSQHFANGYEDLNLDITNLVEKWVSGQIENNGVLIKLSGSFEDGSKQTSFYTKKFFARGSQYFYKKPVIEAAWEDTIKDDRGHFFSTSSILSDSDNTYSLFFYNRFNGKLKNIHGNPNVLLKVYTDENYTNLLQNISCSVSNPYLGVYKADLKVSSTSSVLYDKWHLSGSESTVYYKSSFDLYQYSPQDFYSNEEYIYTITNLKSVYKNNENVTIRIFSRERGWNPNIYTVASKDIENSCVKNLFYRIYRIDDGYEVINYSTGSIAYSKTSYDSKGNYFNLDMSLFEPDYSYGIKLARWDGSILEETKQIYKFRVE